MPTMSSVSSTRWIQATILRRGDEAVPGEPPAGGVDLVAGRVREATSATIAAISGHTTHDDDRRG